MRLHAIGPGDAEHLRSWKNAHRGVFFHHELISHEQQAGWMEAYLARPDDYVFKIERGGEVIGCAGFRVEGRAADVYNVILARPEAAGHDTMDHALHVMLGFARTCCDEVRAKVLRGNARVRVLAESMGFSVVADQGEHYDIVLDWSRFRDVPFEVTDTGSAAPLPELAQGVPRPASPAPTPTDRAAVLAALRAFVAERSPEDLGPDDVDPDASLFDSGLLDSVASVELLTYVEDHYGVVVGEEEMVESIQTLNDLVARVEAQQARAS